jgi:hypothetical protein
MAGDRDPALLFVLRHGRCGGVPSAAGFRLRRWISLAASGRSIQSRPSAAEALDRSLPVPPSLNADCYPKRVPLGNQEPDPMDASQ